MTPDIVVEKITPHIAKDYLGHNTHNRNVRKHHVSSLAEDMKRGNWQIGVGSIKFSADGTLLDGQHTLLAVIESNSTVDMVVVRNMPTEAQMSMDTGARRTFADTLKLAGIPNYTVLGAAVKSIYDWERMGAAMFSGSSAATAVTNKVLWDYYQSNQWINDYVPLLMRLSTSATHIPTRVSGAMVHLLFNISSDDAAFFFERIINGDNIAVGDAPHTLRKTLSDIGKDKRRGSINQRWMAAIIIKAWNRFILGEDCKVLNFRPGGANKEPFPEAKRPINGGPTQ